MLLSQLWDLGTIGCSFVVYKILSGLLPIVLCFWYKNTNSQVLWLPEETVSVFALLLMGLDLTLKYLYAQVDNNCL